MSPHILLVWLLCRSAIMTACVSLYQECATCSEKHLLKSFTDLGCVSWWFKLANYWCKTNYKCKIWWIKCKIKGQHGKLASEALNHKLVNLWAKSLITTFVPWNGRTNIHEQQWCYPWMKKGHKMVKHRFEKLLFIRVFELHFYLHLISDSREWKET